MFREQFDSRSCGMNAQLQCIEIEPALPCYHQFAVERAAGWQLIGQGLQHLRKVAIERFLVPALQQDLAAVAKHQDSKSIPLRFKNPLTCRRNFVHSFGEHG